MQITKVVSVCIRRDLKVWQIASPRILENIEATQYELIVPYCDTKHFQKVTPQNFIISNDEDYITPNYRNKIARLLAQKNEFGPNWFIQQFLKILAVANGQQEDIFLIWDSDTIPLRKLSFIDDAGRLYYYHSDEYHKPYFETIQKLLSLNRIAPYSFISQCFPLYSQWAKMMIQEIEMSFNLPWMEAICTNIAGPGNYFSEYETLGNFALHNFPEFIKFYDGKWERRGGKYFRGNKDSLNLVNQFSECDYVALEHVDIQKQFHVEFYDLIRRILPLSFKEKVRSFLGTKKPGYHINRS